MAQSVKCLSPDFSSGRDLRVMGSSPKLGSMLSMDSLKILSVSLSLSLLLSPARADALKLKKKKKKKKARSKELK